MTSVWGLSCTGELVRQMSLTVTSVHELPLTSYPERLCDKHSSTVCPRKEEMALPGTEHLPTQRSARLVCFQSALQSKLDHPISQRRKMRLEELPGVTKLVTGGTRI